MPSNGAPLQSISITRIENRTLPTPHVVYAVLVALPVRSWTVFRRYSEFLALHQSFTDGKDGMEAAPPSPFPAKNTARKTLRTITGLGGLLSQSESSKDVEDAYQKERRDALEKYLRVIVSSPDSRWRESDVFKAFIELPKTETASSLSGHDRPMKSAAAPSTRYVPGSYSNSFQSKPTPESNGFTTTRRLGAPARETEATRRLDENGLLASQQAQMNSQDTQLDGLAAILRRQKAMGLAINQELLEQNELLETLDQEVDQTQGKMRGAEKQMKKLEK